MMPFTWADVYQRLKSAPPGKLYGIPRGGAIVAGLTGRAVDSVEEADWIVDDICDSGATIRAWTDRTGKRPWVLHTKRPGDEWVQFPWEMANPESDIADTVIRQLEFVGEDVTREGLVDTPRRVIASLKEMTGGYAADVPALLEVQFQTECDEMVMVHGINFVSLCEHHMMPFWGTATIGYIPAGNRVVGLSKLPRLVDAYAKRLQIQERLTHQIASALVQHLAPIGVGVILEATHSCCRFRGADSAAQMTTSSMMGELRDKPEARAEFLALRGRHG